VRVTWEVNHYQKQHEKWPPFTHPHPQSILVMEEPEARLHPRFQSLLADFLTDTWRETSPAARAIVEEIIQTMRENNHEPDPEAGESYDDLISEPFCGERFLDPTFVVETHSEYLIRRMQVLVATGKVDSRDVSIHYLSDPSQRSSDGEACWPIEINNDGTLTRDFGPGFLGEAANLIDELWEAWKPKSSS
jgi:hypothetical protein